MRPIGGRMKVVGVVSAILLGGLLSTVALAGNNGKGTSGHRVDILHKPGTPAARQITIDISALPAHLAHGDAGLCGIPRLEKLVQVEDEATDLWVFTAFNCTLSQVADILVAGLTATLGDSTEEGCIRLDGVVIRENADPLSNYFSDGYFVFDVNDLDDPNLSPDGPYQVVAYYRCGNIAD